MNESIIPVILASASIVVFGLTFLLAKDKKKNMYTNFNLVPTM
jgi:hypothetical protein